MPEMTVGQQRENIRAFLADQEARGEVADGDDFWAEKMVALGRYPDEMPLWDLGQALDSDALDAGQKFILKWQRRHDYAPSHFQEAFFTLISHADDLNLERLSRGWPDEVAALRAWREDANYSRALRLMPFSFDL